MCGIAGLIGLEYPENQMTDIIKNIQSSLRHRGSKLGKIFGF